MKKIFLLTIFACSALWAHAQVAFLLRTAEINDLPAENFNSVDQQPEKNAAIWFENTYSATGKAILTLDQVKSGALLSAGQPAYKVLWVNVDEVGLADLSTAGIDADVIMAIGNYVKAGGNLLLTKQATRLAHDIGRMALSNDMTWPTTGSYNNSGTLAIQPLLGSNLSDEKKRDARQHPIYAGMENYDFVSGVGVNISGYNNDANYSWKEMYRTNGTRTGNGEISQLDNFQSDWSCSVLALQGNIGDFCLPVILEFHPQGDYKGTILTIGSAAYQWGTNNGKIENVKTLTSNALNYLKQGGDTYGYYMPYTLSEVYSIDTYRPEYLSAKWFYDNYVTTGKGRFIHKEEVFPTGMKVLWVHGDRQGQGKDDFYNAMGGNTFKDKLKSFVENGGNVFLSKQATHFAYRIGRTDWEPSYDNQSYKSDEVTWYMVSNFVAVGTGVDRHNHRAFQYMEEYTNHMKNETESEGKCKWPLVNATGGSGNEHSDHKYFWGEPSEVWNNTYHISHSSTQIERLNAFESAQTCQILGGWGHTTALDGAGMIEFLPTAKCSGTIIAQGLPAYQWTTSNTKIGNVQNLTKGVLRYLLVVDPRVPGCDNCFYYISE